MSFEFTWVNIPYIFRLIKRFQLSEIRREPDSFLLLKTIQPVTQADQLLRSQKCGTLGTFSRLGATGVGLEVAYTVPATKRLSLRAVTANRNSGDGTLNGIYVNGVVKVFSQTAAASLETEILTQDILLDETMTLQVYVAAITTNSAWTIRAVYQEEDAF